MTTRQCQKPPPGLVFIEDYTADDGTVIPGIASRLGISPSTYRKWRMAGIGPETFRVGKRVVARVEAVEDYLTDLERAAHEARGIENPECRPAEPRVRRAA